MVGSQPKEKKEGEGERGKGERERSRQRDNQINSGLIMNCVITHIVFLHEHSHNLWCVLDTGNS